MLICILDLTLPNKGEQIHILDVAGDNSIEILPENAKEHFTEYNKGKFIWRESTRILNQPMRYSYLHGNQVRTTRSEFNFYIPGIVFVIFLAFGAVYGVFFKKSNYQERRVMYFNIIVGSVVCLMYVVSLGKVV